MSNLHKTRENVFINIWNVVQDVTDIILLIGKICHEYDYKNVEYREMWFEFWAKVQKAILRQF
mgnify:CR=1 FL=1